MKWDEIPSKLGGAFLPFALLCVAWLAFLYWQFEAISDRRGDLNLIVTTQEAQITKASQEEKQVATLASDLFQLAKSGDPGAIAIVKKFGIAKQTPGGPAN